MLDGLYPYIIGREVRGMGNWDVPRPGRAID
jgi:hypothetical protein